MQPAIHRFSPNPKGDTTHSTRADWDLLKSKSRIPTVGPIDDPGDSGREYRVHHERGQERVSTEQVEWPQTTVHLADECHWSLVGERAKRVQIGKAVRSLQAQYLTSGVLKGRRTEAGHDVARLVSRESGKLSLNIRRYAMECTAR